MANSNVNMRTNTMIMLLYQISMYLVPLITIPYVSRVLGPQGVGVYSYTSSIMSFCIVLTTMGVSIYGKREIASCLDIKSRTEAFWSIFIIETLMLLITTTGYIAYIIISDTPYRIASWLQLLALLGAWLDISWLYFGVENFKLAIVRNILIRILSLVAIFMFVKEKAHTNLYVLIIALSDFVSVIPLWLMAKKYVNFIIFNLADIKQRVIPMLKMLVTAVSLNLFTITDKIILGSFASIALVGIYDNAFRISKVTVSIITTIGVVMLPRMTKMFAEGSNKSFEYFQRSLSLTMFIGAGCGFGLIAVAPTFVPLYLGSEFHESIFITQILAIVLIFIAWGNVFRSQYILPNKMDKLYVRSVLYAVSTNIILNFILIPKYSIYGAAVAYIFTEGLIAVYQTVKIRNAFDIIALLKSNLKYVISGFSMCIVIYVLNILILKDVASFISLLIQVFSGALVYIILVCRLEVKDKHAIVWYEISRIINLIKKLW